MILATHIKEVVIYYVALLIASAFFFSFQPHASIEYSKSCTASYIKTFEDMKEIKTTGDECMPLIPKPPSYELASAEINLREQISGDNIIQEDAMTHRKAQPSNEINTLPSTDPTSTHETKVPGIQTNKTSTYYLSTNPLVMDPLSSLKSLYNDAKILCQIQTDNKSQELVSSNMLKAASINEDVTNSPFVLAKSTVLNSTNKSNALPTTSNSQKVRFNLNLNDIKYTDECQEIKRARLECVNLSRMPNEYALRKSPSDPSVCFLPSINVESSFNTNIVLPSIDAKPESSILSNEFQKHEIPPRERKVRFQTSLDTKDNGVKSNASFTLPRNHKVLTISKHRAAQESFEKIYSQLDQDYLNIQRQRY